MHGLLCFSPLVHVLTPVLLFLSLTHSLTPHSPLAYMFGGCFLFSLSSPDFFSLFVHGLTLHMPTSCMFVVCFLLSLSVHGLTSHMHTMHVWSFFFPLRECMFFFLRTHVLAAAVTPLLFSSFFRFFSFIQYDD